VCQVIEAHLRTDTQCHVGNTGKSCKAIWGSHSTHLTVIQKTSLKLGLLLVRRSALLQRRTSPRTCRPRVCRKSLYNHSRFAGAHVRSRVDYLFLYSTM